MYLAGPARILIILAIAITAVSCSKDALPCTSIPGTHTPSLPTRIEEDPFNYVLSQYT